MRLVREEAEVRDAAARALLLLARSQHTLRDLRLKLERRRYSPGAIRRVLERLEELGYLDDARAADTWVERRLERHPAGRASLLAGLGRHGVSRETAEEAVDAHLPLHAEEEVARRVLRKLYPSEEARENLARGPERDRAMRKLLARGFSRASARKALPGGTGEEDWGPEE